MATDVSSSGRNGTELESIDNARPSTAPSLKPVTIDCGKDEAIDSRNGRYSSFTDQRKWLIICLGSFAGAFSPLSSFIYFPAIPALSEALNVPISRINLTVTSYLVVAGLAPVVLGNIADIWGRRAVYLFMLMVYCCASVGLSLQTSWTALLILRMIQSIGSAATIALGYGLVSDIATPAERGHFVSAVVLGPNISTAIGPILSGVLVQYASWRWIFWLLVILSGICIVLIALLLPETARTVVGDGTAGSSALHLPLLDLLKSCLNSTSNRSHTRRDRIRDHNDTRSSRSRLPNPLITLQLLLNKDCLLVILIFGIFYMNLSCVQASTAALFIDIFQVSDLIAGVIYLPAGIGSVVGAYGAGYLLKHDYHTTAKRHGLSVNKRSGDDLTNFPIEEARLRSIQWTITLAGLCTIAYGWALRYRAHIAIPLILQFSIGLATAIVFNTTGTLLTDIHPSSPSSASAANSIIRCLLAGGGLAVVQILIDAVGVQWTFTLFGLISLSCSLIAWFEYKYGQGWRRSIAANAIR